MGTRTSSGTASTTAKTVLRRESSIFGTANISRPPSALSDAGSVTSKERKSSDPPAPKPLARSVRPNGPPSATILNRRLSDASGTMGPPPSALKRTSLSPTGATNTSAARIPSSLARSPPLAPATRHRVSSSLDSMRGATGRRDSVLSASGVSKQSEKENIEVTPRPATRRVPVPA